MFLGTTPNIVAQYVFGQLKQLAPTRVVVPFSGNFVFESIACQISSVKEIVCSDVSAYSGAIGCYLSGNDSGIRFTEESKARYAGLSDETSLDVAAGLIYLQDVSESATKTKLYYEKLNRHTTLNSARYLNHIRLKLERFKQQFEKISVKFTFGDAAIVIKEVKRGDVVLYDPPTIVGDYEKQYRWLHGTISWQEPQYENMTDQIKWRQLEHIIKKNALVFYRNNGETSPPDLSQCFKYSYSQKQSYCIYTNRNDSDVWVGKKPGIGEKPVVWKIIGQ